MFVSGLQIENFKRIAATEVPLTPITVLVGGNNSGKTCALQAPHFAVNLLQATVVVGDRTIPAQNLRYLPTGDILDLPHGERLTRETAPVRICFHLKDTFEASESQIYSVSLTRGEGLNVHVESSANELAETLLSDYAQPFSIYVPGLAGIPLREEFRSAALIASAMARGDANLFLRNVLLRISRDVDKLAQLNLFLDRILPGAALLVEFDGDHDSTIEVRIRQGERQTPLDAMGTGILQFLQILAYVIDYRPRLLLLDEPDAHLHPNNQRLIARLLQDIVRTGDTQVILATHSRTLLDAFRSIEEASFVWLEQGEVQTEASQEHIAMLMALGALDGSELFYSTDCSAVFLTEDTDLDFIPPLLRANGIDPDRTMIRSYETSSRLQAAFELAKFIKSIKPAVRVIVHRDRDFMTDEAVEHVAEMYNKGGADIDLFVTQGCDIEHYFTRPEHIAASLGIELSAAQAMIEQALEENKVPMTLSYAYKMDALKGLYADIGVKSPKDKNVTSGRLLTRDHVVGKTLVGKVIEIAQATIHNPKAKLTVPAATLVDTNLEAIAARIPTMGATTEAKNG